MSKVRTVWQVIFRLPSFSLRLLPVRSSQTTFEVKYPEAGNYSVEAIYSGNDYYNSVSAKKNFTVAQMIPNVTLSVADIPWGAVEYINVTVKFQYVYLTIKSTSDENDLTVNILVDNKIVKNIQIKQ